MVAAARRRGPARVRSLSLVDIPPEHRGAALRAAFRWRSFGEIRAQLLCAQMGRQRIMLTRALVRGGRHVRRRARARSTCVRHASSAGGGGGGSGDNDGGERPSDPPARVCDVGLRVLRVSPADVAHRCNPVIARSSRLRSISRRIGRESAALTGRVEAGRWSGPVASPLVRFRKDPAPLESCLKGDRRNAPRSDRQALMDANDLDFP